MEGVEDASIGGVPKAIGFGMGGIADENAGSGSLEEFGIIGGDERVGTASNFTEMGEGGRTVVPEFVGSSSINGGGRSEVGEVSSSCAEFIPEVGGCITGNAHGTSFVEEGAV
jgi:hypothetical protein